MNHPSPDRLDSLIVQGAHFRDTAGRFVILRGVNLGGDCKVPYPYGGTNYPSDFADHREVSFVGRPFPLDEADAHLARLRHWGFNLVRLLVTWEAIEHAGPGLHDAEYLDYIAEVCRRAGEHGLYVFIDFHQDVWSRMTGGSGAPGWTFEAAGLDFTQFHAAGAAHVMQHLYDYDRGGWQDGYPQMSWGINHRLPPTSIMWTMFWTGQLFTPRRQIEGENIQDFLQSRYLGCMDAVARRVANLANVIGFDTLNEPVPGWVGRPMRYRHVGPSAVDPLRPRLGPAMSPLDALLAARGITVRVPIVERDPATGALSAAREAIVNEAGVSIWGRGVDCPFEEAGAYRVEGGEVVAVDHDFFSRRDGRTLSAPSDAYRPLFHAVADVTRAHRPDWAVFAEIEPYAAASGRGFPADMPERSVNASHWYDYTTLYTKRFKPDAAFDFETGETAHGRDALRAVYRRKLDRIAAQGGAFSSDGAPTLIGEFGIPYDLDHGAGFAAWHAGDHSDTPWQEHVDALALMYEAMDELQLHSAQWNYTASNRNDLMIGDGWNQEDLSIFSQDQQSDPSDPDSGGRAVAGFCRPYVRRTAGRLGRMAFDQDTGVFCVVIDDAVPGVPTEIYLPRRHFGDAPSIELEAGRAHTVFDAQAQSLLLTAEASGRIVLVAQTADRASVRLRAAAT
jgi:hypothetical protein